MRNAIISAIHDQMKLDKDIFFLTGDLGFNLLEPIEKDFPDRFIDVGIAEQNMMGVATGLSLSGKKVYVYSIIPFVTMRCFEQIRNDICYHDADVTILGVGSGLSYGILSSTHFALEDIAVMRSLPNMTIFSPTDEVEALSGLEFFRNYYHPLYLRIGKKTEPMVFQKEYQFDFHKGSRIVEGDDGVIFTTGAIASEVIEASNLIFKLKKKKISVVTIPVIKPINADFILSECLGKKNIFTVEEHSIIGGLGSAIAEIISEKADNLSLVRIGTNDLFIQEVGDQSYLRQKNGLDAESISNKIFENLAE